MIKQLFFSGETTASTGVAKEESKAEVGMTVKMATEEARATSQEQGGLKEDGPDSSIGIIRDTSA